MLFDSDLGREDYASPAGLHEFGKLAALAADRPRSFYEFYRAIENSRRGPYFGSYYPRDGSAARFFQDEFAASASRSAVWHFERPTQWDVWLAEQGELAGGVRENFQTVLSEGEGIRVRFDGESIPRMFQFLASLLRPARSGVTLQGVTSLPKVTDDRPLLVAPVTPKGYAVASVFGLSMPSGPVALPNIVGLARLEDGVAVLDRFGGATDVFWNGVKRSRQLPFRPTHVGLGCYAVLNDTPLLVDPVRGTLQSEFDWLPNRRWIGVSVTEGGELLLASADQSMTLYDAVHRRELLHFPAEIWPSVRLNFGECAIIMSGTNWYAALNPLASRLSFYSASGASLGAIDLRERFSLPSAFVSSAAGAGDEVGILFHHDRSLQVLHVDLPQ